MLLVDELSEERLDIEQVYLRCLFDFGSCSESNVNSLMLVLSMNLTMRPEAARIRVSLFVEVKGHFGSSGWAKRARLPQMFERL